MEERSGIHVRVPHHVLPCSQQALSFRVPTRGHNLAMPGCDLAWNLKVLGLSVAILMYSIQMQSASSCRAAGLY